MSTNLQKVKYADNKDDQVYKIAEVANKFGAPYLVPFGNSEITYNVWGNSEYPWSVSPKSVTQYIPKITLKEYRLKYSSELLSLINSAKGRAEAFNRVSWLGSNDVTNILAGALAAGTTIRGTAIVTQTAINAAARLGDLAAAAAGVRGGPAVADAARAAVANVKGIAQAAAAAAENAAGFAAGNVLVNSIQNTLADPENLFLSFGSARKSDKGLMDPYDGLYYATATNINYDLPYVSIDNMVSINSTWGEPGKESIINKAFDTAKEFLSNNAKGAKFAFTTFDLNVLTKEASLAAAEPGFAREKIKGYAPSDKGDTLTLTFYLYNTLSLEQIRNNWEFLYVLTYQNLPNRRSVNLLDPPCVYEVTVPGHKHFPIASIEGLTVQNVGTTRCINIYTGELSTPDANSGAVKIVPEAYQVKLTIRNLLTTTQNIFKWSDTSSNAVSVINKKELSPEQQKAKEVVKQVEKAATPVAGGGTGGVFIPRGGFNAQNSSSSLQTKEPGTP